MRPAARLLAAVQKGATYLEAGAPTGLTGLPTSPAPRTALLYLYHETLSKLKEFPESSVYRQSTEALTKHRLRIIEESQPAGLAEWQTRVKDVVDAHPETYKRVSDLAGKENSNIAWRARAQAITQFGNTSDEHDTPPARLPEQLEGPRFAEEVPNRGAAINRDPLERTGPMPIEAEPALTAEQIGEIEAKIGAGLIEEVIEVAEGELLLAQNMAENRVWEELVEKPVEGQWTYSARDTHTGTTQKA